MKRYNTTAPIQSYDGFVNVFGALDNQLAILEQIRQDPPQRELVDLMHNAFRTAAAGSGSISGLIDFGAFGRFMYYTGLCTSRCFLLELEEDNVQQQQQNQPSVCPDFGFKQDHKVDVPCDVFDNKNSNTNAMNNEVHNVTGIQHDQQDNATTRRQSGASTNNDINGMSNNSHRGSFSTMMNEGSINHQSLQNQQQRFILTRRIPEGTTLSEQTIKKVFQFLSTTFRTSSSASPVLRFVGFCLALLHIGHIMLSFAYGGGEELLSMNNHNNNHNHHHPVQILRALFSLNKLDSFITKFCSISPYPEDLMKNTSFLPIEVWRWCPALDSVFVYYCNNTEQVKPYGSTSRDREENEDLEVSDSDEDDEDEDEDDEDGGKHVKPSSRVQSRNVSRQSHAAGDHYNNKKKKRTENSKRDLLTRGRFLQFALDLGLGTGFDLVAAERIFDELAANEIETESKSDRRRVRAEAKRRRKEEEEKLIALQAQSNLMKKGGNKMPTTAKNANQRRALAEQIQSIEALLANFPIEPIKRRKYKVMSFVAFTDAIVKIACLTQQSKNLAQKEKDEQQNRQQQQQQQRRRSSTSAEINKNNNSNNSSSSSLIVSTVPDAVERFLLGVIGPLFQLATDGADILAARSLVVCPSTHVDEQSMFPRVLYSGKGKHNATSSSSSSAKNDNSFGKSELLTITGKNLGALGMGAWVYCSVSPVAVQHVSAETIDRINTTNNNNNNYYSLLEFKLSPGESSDLIWASADISLSANTSEYLEVDITFKAPVFVAVGNTPEQLIFEASPTHVGTIVLELKTALIPSKLVELAESHFAVGCTTTSGLNKHQLYEEGWRFLCSKLALSAGRHHRNCLGCGPAEVVNSLDRQGILDAVFRSRSTRASTETSGRPFMKFPAFLDTLIRFAISHGCAVDSIGEVIRSQLQLVGIHGLKEQQLQQQRYGSGGASSPTSHQQALMMMLRSNEDDLKELQGGKYKHLLPSGASTAATGGMDDLEQELSQQHSGVDDGEENNKKSKKQDDAESKAAESVLAAMKLRKKSNKNDNTNNNASNANSTISQQDRDWANRRLIEAMTSHKAQQQALREQLYAAKEENEELSEKLEEAHEATTTLSKLAEEFFAVSDLAFEQVMRHTPDKSIHRLVQSFRNTVSSATERHHDLLSSVKVKLAEKPTSSSVRREVFSLDEKEKQEQDEKEAMELQRQNSASSMNNNNNNNTSTENSNLDHATTKSLDQKMRSFNQSLKNKHKNNKDQQDSDENNSNAKNNSKKKPETQLASSSVFQTSVGDMIEAMKEIQKKEAETAAAAAAASLLKERKQSMAAASGNNNNNNNNTGGGGGTSGESNTNKNNSDNSNKSPASSIGDVETNNNNHNNNHQSSSSSSSHRASSATARMMKNAADAQLLIDNYERDLKDTREQLVKAKREVTLKEQKFSIEKQKLEGEKYELKDQIKKLEERLKTSQETAAMMVLRSKEAAADATEAHQKLQKLSSQNKDYYGGMMSRGSTSASGNSSRASSPIQQQQRDNESGNSSRKSASRKSHHHSRSSRRRAGGSQQQERSSPTKNTDFDNDTNKPPTGSPTASLRRMPSSSVRNNTTSNDLVSDDNDKHNSSTASSGVLPDKNNNLLDMNNNEIISASSTTTTSLLRQQQQPHLPPKAPSPSAFSPTSSSSVIHHHQKQHQEQQPSNNNNRKSSVVSSSASSSSRHHKRDESNTIEEHTHQQQHRRISGGVIGRAGLSSASSATSNTSSRSSSPSATAHQSHSNTTPTRSVSVTGGGGGKASSTTFGRRGSNLSLIHQNNSTSATTAADKHHHAAPIDDDVLKVMRGEGPTVPGMEQHINRLKRQGSLSSLHHQQHQQQDGQPEQNNTSSSPSQNGRHSSFVLARPISSSSSTSTSNSVSYHHHHHHHEVDGNNNPKTQQLRHALNHLRLGLATLKQTINDEMHLTGKWIDKTVEVYNNNKNDDATFILNHLQQKKSVSVQTDVRGEMLVVNSKTNSNNRYDDDGNDSQQQHHYHHSNSSRSITPNRMMRNNNQHQQLLLQSQQQQQKFVLGNVDDLFIQGGKSMVGGASSSSPSSASSGRIMKGRAAGGGTTTMYSSSSSTNRHPQLLASSSSPSSSPITDENRDRLSPQQLRKLHQQQVIKDKMSRSNVDAAVDGSSHQQQYPIAGDGSDENNNNNDVQVSPTTNQSSSVLVSVDAADQQDHLRKMKMITDKFDNSRNLRFNKPNTASSQRRGKLLSSSSVSQKVKGTNSIQSARTIPTDHPSLDATYGNYDQTSSLSARSLISPVGRLGAVDKDNNNNNKKLFGGVTEENKSMSVGDVSMMKTNNNGDGDNGGSGAGGVLITGTERQRLEASQHHQNNAMMKFSSTPFKPTIAVAPVLGRDHHQQQFGSSEDGEQHHHHRHHHQGSATHDPNEGKIGAQRVELSPVEQMVAESVRQKHICGGPPPSMLPRANTRISTSGNNTTANNVGQQQQVFGISHRDNNNSNSKHGDDENMTSKKKPIPPPSRLTKSENIGM